MMDDVYFMHGLLLVLMVLLVPVVCRGRLGGCGVAVVYIWWKGCRMGMRPHDWNGGVGGLMAMDMGSRYNWSCH
jgi:hypothetical protein